MIDTRTHSGPFHAYRTITEPPKSGHTAQHSHNNGRQRLYCDECGSPVELMAGGRYALANCATCELDYVVFAANGHQVLVAASSAR